MPATALRDLLGVVRALYRAEVDSGSSPERLAQLVEIGRTLRASLKLAGEHPAVISYGHAMWNAERAVKELAVLAGESHLAPLIDAVARRFTCPKPSFSK